MSDLPLTPDLAAAPQRFLWHAPTRTAVLADLHLGYEAALARAGTPMPEFTTAPLTAAWHAILARRPARIIVAGDLFHTDAPAPAAVALAAGLFAAAPCPVAITPGNHDPAPATLRTLFAPQGVTVADTLQITPALHVAHGHVLPDPLPRGDWILGHQHPAVRVGGRAGVVKMICFATAQYPHGPWKGRTLILLPAFSPAPLGSNLLTGHYWIVNAPAPAPANVQIAGIVGLRVLPFGTLEGLSA